MSTKEILGYVAYGLGIILVVVLFQPDLRNKAIKLYRGKPYVELSNNDSRLEIREFKWGYGLTGFNQFSGDFDKLEHDVYDILKGKSGTCQIYLESQSKDKYGNADGSLQYIGDIDINELNKYQNWTYWRKEAGIRKLLYDKFIKQEEPPALPDSAEAIPQPTTPVVEAPIISTARTYNFSFTDLYPMPETQQRFDQNRYTVNGTIGAVNYENGIMEVVTNDGETLTVQFYPMETGSYNQQQLMLALKQGNKITSVCARAGASTLDLISAEIIAN